MKKMAPEAKASDELPIFRPRIGKKRNSRANAVRFRTAVMRLGRAGGRALRAVGRPARIAVGGQGAGARRVVVKAHIVRMTAYGVKAARLHLRYIERDGLEKDGRTGELYGPEGKVDRAAFEAPRGGERHQFRLVVSPEDARELDLTAFVRELMKRVERDLGQRLEWAAVNHHDTEHPHAHVVLRGVDRRGAEVRLDRAYVAHGLRGRAQEIATEELGPRSRLERDRAQAAEVTRDRVTSLDRVLALREEGGVVVARTPSGVRRGVDESLLVGRLEHLAALRLAERRSKTSWALAAGWMDRLRELGERGDILKEMHRAVRGDPGRYRVVGDGQTPEPARSVVVGRVAVKGLADELRGSFYAVIEAVDGMAYRVPVDRRAAESARVGDLVSWHAGAQGTPGAARPQAFLRAMPLSLEEQATYRGPVWLDRVEDNALAPYGFGAQVRNALERRQGELAKLGIDPAAPDRDARLRAIERGAVGEGVARRTGRVAVATEVRMQGRVEIVESAGGRAYAVVSDAARFVVVPATRPLRELEGQTVVLERSARGRVRVRAPERER